MAATDISPNSDNYFSGKGIAKFKLAGASVYRDMGDCSKFALTPNVTRLEHYSSRGGIRTRDLNLISQRQLSVEITFDEFTVSNLAMALMGTVEVAATPSTSHYDASFDIMATDEIRGALRLVGTNDAGARVQVDIPDVVFAGNGALEFIQEALATGNLTGEINGPNFGTLFWNTTQEINP